MSITLLAVTACASTAGAAEAIVAVATNFSECAEMLRLEFEADNGHDLTLSAGSTGKLYAQVMNGAPYAAFLSADGERPALLEESGTGVSGSRFVYAKGRIALWTTEEERVGDKVWQDILREGEFGSLAIANPALAPYGLAARQALRSLDLWEAVQDRVVMGENVGQTYALVATGNAELGFVALSSLMSRRHEDRGRYWTVPGHLHQPVAQEAVLLQRGANNAAAIAFLDYLKTDAAGSIIESFGYGLD